MTGHVFSNYSRFPLAFTEGKGCYLFDEQQRAYLDFASGIATSSLGHGHPALIEALEAQMHKVWHTSNLYRITKQEELAELLCHSSFADKVFFCNSGLEANEAALKLVRKYFAHKGMPERQRFLVIDGAFHGRSMALIGASPTGKMIEGFTPLPDWFDHAPADDLDEVATQISAETAAIVLEPLQGDGGGIHLFDIAYMQGLRKLCDQHGILLVLDEIQCGNGRTGKLWCHEHSEITPDIMSTAKGLGGGFPIGAVLTTEEIACALTPGSHGSTFGGNPLACAVGCATIRTINTPEMLHHVKTRGNQLAKGLKSLVAKYPSLFKEDLGLGLMRGLKCQDDITNADMVKKALDLGLLLVPAGENVVRLLPPLIVSEAEVKQALEILENLCAEWMFSLGDA